MEIEPLETILAELVSSDWLEIGRAIRKLVPHGDDAVIALPRLFELTLHEKSPVVSNSCALIKRLGKLAVPFLREKVDQGSAEQREVAIALLTETGFRWSSSTRLVDQVLELRRDDLPDWGVDADVIISVFRQSLNDHDLSVRFKAACALEEFGRHVTETIPVFIDALRVGNQHQQNWAALHLGRIGSPAIDAACGDLIKAAKSNCRYTSLAATNALRHIAGRD